MDGAAASLCVLLTMLGILGNRPAVEQGPAACRKHSLDDKSTAWEQCCGSAAAQQQVLELCE